MKVSSPADIRAIAQRLHTPHLKPCRLCRRASVLSKVLWKSPQPQSLAVSFKSTLFHHPVSEIACSNVSCKSLTAALCRLCKPLDDLQTGLSSSRSDSLEQNAACFKSLLKGLYCRFSFEFESCFSDSNSSIISILFLLRSLLRRPPSAFNNLRLFKAENDRSRRYPQ
jgi:hypothetical protein